MRVLVFGFYTCLGSIVPGFLLLRFYCLSFTVRVRVFLNACYRFALFYGIQKKIYINVQIYCTYKYNDMFKYALKLFYLCLRQCFGSA